MGEVDGLERGVPQESLGKIRPLSKLFTREEAMTREQEKFFELVLLAITEKLERGEDVRDDLEKVARDMDMVKTFV